MRRLVPFAGIALAVAVGIALAPYLWELFALTVLFLAFCVGVALCQRAWRRITGAIGRASGSAPPASH